MKRFYVLSLSIVVVLTSLAVVLPVSDADAADPVECSWGALKCCFANPPCVSACCPRPKENIEQAAIWLPPVVRFLVNLV